MKDLRMMIKCMRVSQKKQGLCKHGNRATIQIQNGNLEERKARGERGERGKREKRKEISVFKIWIESIRIS